MAWTIQRKITTVYSSWLFATVMLIFIYVFFFKGSVFFTYGEAMPWITGYIALAILGNIGALAAVAYFLKPGQNSLTYLLAYEVIFLIVLALGYLIVARQYLPSGGFGAINFETILNAVLPFIFIGIIIFEFIFSKALRLMLPKNN
jgi:hypothetical protein